MRENVTEQLANLVNKVGFDDLPEEVVSKVKLMLLDCIGSALGSYITDRAKIAVEFVEELGGNPQASIIGGRRTSYALAAFTNAELINALDCDYNGPITGHVCPFVVSPCLAVAEREHASGKELILALTLAHEIGGRMVSSLAQHKLLKDEPPYYEESPRFSYTSNIFGGVAGTGKLLKLDVDRMRNAFGIGGASTAVPATMKWEHTGGPSVMLKYGTWAGWIAQLATVAALLAEKGFTGDTTILDGEWGFWQIVGSPFFKVDKLLKGLGEVWHTMETKFKPYPTCSITHTAIDGICSIMEEHEIKPEEIEEIVVKGDPMHQTPNRIGTEIKSFQDIQFFETFIYALAAYHGRSPSPAWQTPDIYNRPEIKALAKKVKLAVHPRIKEYVTELVKAGKLPLFRGTIVEITAKGKKFTADVPMPKGSLENPMTDTELIEKFRENASYSKLKTSKTEEIIRVVSELDKLSDVTELAKLLTIT